MKEQKTTLEQLKESDKSVRIYNGKRQILPSPSEVLEKFHLPIEFIKLGTASLHKSDTTEEETKVYSTYVIESKLHDNEVIEGFYGTVGMLINTSQNKIQVYSGMNASACTNLNIFGADNIETLNLLNSLSGLDDVIIKAKKELFKKLEYIKIRKEELEAKTYNTKQFEDKKGELLSKMNIGLADYIIHAEETFRDKNSLYYDMPKSDWTLLSAMTDKIKLESPSKRLTSTLALEELFV